MLHQSRFTSWSLRHRLTLNRCGTLVLGLALFTITSYAQGGFVSGSTGADGALNPTTALVELLSGRSFEFESYTGYMSSDRRFVIAVSCAGVNFLITSFLMLALRFLWRRRFEKVGWSFLPLTAVLAYVATVIANAVRICIALEIQRRAVEIEGLSANQLHRLEGIVVYFAFLLLLFVFTDRSQSTNPRRRLLFPLVVYYATTLGIPLLNGSFHQGSPFWEHFVFVLVLPLIVFVPFALFCGYRRQQA